MLKVLVVEDHVILADILENFLETAGYSVCGIATNVAEAVRLADLHKPDLAVIDYRMADGELGSQIRSRLKDKTTMGILFASGDSLGTKLTVADGDAYLQKPYQMKDLLEAVHIVHEIKEHRDISRLPFPRNFRLLKNAVKPDRLST